MIVLFNFIVVCNLNGQYCYFDSINNKKYQYDQYGKLEFILRNGIVIPSFDSAIFYSKMSYDSDNLLSSVSEYIVKYSGDTILAPFITTKFEYDNGLLSRVWKYSDVIIDDFIWEGNNITEYKYYYFQYLSDSIIDSTLTRITQLSYLNNNIRHYFYQEISTGYIFSNYYYYYDDKYNPYYGSEVALVDLSILGYSCSNNWISTSSGLSRIITYNAQNYPIYIITDWNNGNFWYDTFTYDCTNITFERPFLNEYKLEFIPNPTTDYFIIKSNVNQKIKEVKIFDINGVLLLNENDSEKINVKELKPGIYIVECCFGEITLRKKIIIYTS